jgi:putative transposase
VSVAGFIAAQRAQYRIPHATTCWVLGLSQAWFYKWRHGDASPRHARREQLAAKIKQLFAAHKGRYGSPRITAELREEGWRVSVNTVAQVMAEQGLRARPKRRRHQTTRPGRGRWRAPDLVGRDFAAATINHKWYGDGTEIGTEEGKLFLDSVLDVASRRIVGFAMSSHHDTDCAYGALAMAVAVRGGSEAVAGLILHTDQAASTPRTGSGPLVSGWGFGSRWAGLGRRWTMRSSNPGIPPWSSSCAPSSGLPPGPRPAPRSRPGSYNCHRRHSALQMRSPIDFERGPQAA